MLTLCHFGVILVSDSLKESLVLQYAKYGLKKPTDINRKILIDVNVLWLKPKIRKNVAQVTSANSPNRVLEAEAFAKS